MMRAIPYVFGSLVALVLLGCNLWAAEAYLPDLLVSGNTPLIFKLLAVFVGTSMSALLIALLWTLRREYLEGYE